MGTKTRRAPSRGAPLAVALPWTGTSFRPSPPQPDNTRANSAGAIFPKRCISPSPRLWHSLKDQAILRHAQLVERHGVDVLLDEADGAIAEDEVDPAGVEAGGTVSRGP